MNNIKTIKALLASPSVESVRCKWGEGQAVLDSPIDPEAVFFFTEMGAPDSIEINWREWPEIAEGDLVMTPDDQGIVEFINDKNHGYLVRSDDWKLPYMRHEIALLQKSDDNSEVVA
jgi:hypothetical protein